MLTQNRPSSSERVSLNGIDFSNADIFRVVDQFYRLVAVDEILRVPFSSVSDWPHHIEKMTHFWWFKFGGSRYLDETYDPITKHYKAGFDAKFLERWLGLFHTVLAQNLTVEQAEHWRETSTRMGQFLLSRNQMLKELEA